MSTHAVSRVLRHLPTLLVRHLAAVLAIGCALLGAIGHVVGGHGGAGLKWDLIALGFAALGDWFLVTSAVGYGVCWAAALILEPSLPMLIDNFSFIPVLVAGLKGARNVQLWVSVAFVFLMLQPWNTPADSWLRIATAAGMFAVVWFITESIQLAASRERDGARQRAAKQRRRVARDLHDGTVHRLSLLSMRVQQLQLNGPVAATKLDPVLDDIDEAIRGLRQMITVLRQEEWESMDLKKPHSPRQDCLTAVQRIEAAGFPTLCEVPPIYPKMSAKVAAVFGDVVREAANNVLRHGSKRAPVVLRVVCSESMIELVLCNAFNEPVEGERRDHFGLAALEEDVGRLGGELMSAGDDGQWVLRLALPTVACQALAPLED